MDILSLFNVAVVLLLGLCLGALWFYGYGIYSTISYLAHQDAVDQEFRPRLTILKPLCGVDAETYTNLLSFCQQDYPHYQIVFGVQNPADPCIELVQKLMRQFPELDIQLVVSNRTIGINPKVNNVANAAEQAKYSLWVLADSDIRVGPDYLQTIVQPFRYPGVGVVTCPYRSLADNWVSRLEALGTATEFHPGVLVSRQMEGVHFALGSTIAIRQEVLSKFGGFEAIADYLADDFQLGRLPASVGYRVVLSRYVVEHGLSHSSGWEALQRQIRWARGIRVSRFWGYLGKGISYGTVTSLLLVCLLHGSIWGWVMLSGVWSARLTLGLLVGVGCLNDASTRRYWWLLPLYDLISFGIWCCGLIGNSIAWRGQQFRLLAGGKLQALVKPQSSYLPILEEPVLKN
jgi:ceramide glucosyltransferase